MKLLAKTKAAKELEKQRLSSEDLRNTELNRRSINAAELNFALQTGSLRKQSAKQAATASDAGNIASESANTKTEGEASATGENCSTIIHMRINLLSSGCQFLI